MRRILGLLLLAAGALLGPVLMSGRTEAAQCPPRCPEPPAPAPQPANQGPGLSLPPGPADATSAPAGAPPDAAAVAPTPTVPAPPAAAATPAATPHIDRVVVQPIDAPVNGKKLTIVPAGDPSAGDIGRIAIGVVLVSLVVAVSSGWLFHKLR
ncbi:MAG: hypothetical protein ACR2GX_08215 [Candidatus Dormibacteria bacterium]